MANPDIHELLDDGLNGDPIEPTGTLQPTPSADLPFQPGETGYRSGAEEEKAASTLKERCSGTRKQKDAAIWARGAARQGARLLKSESMAARSDAADALRLLATPGNGEGEGGDAVDSAARARCSAIRKTGVISVLVKLLRDQTAMHAARALAEILAKEIMAGYEAMREGCVEACAALAGAEDVRCAEGALRCLAHLCAFSRTWWVAMRAGADDGACAQTIREDVDEGVLEASLRLLTVLALAGESEASNGIVIRGGLFGAVQALSKPGKHVTAGLGLVAALSGTAKWSDTVAPKRRDEAIRAKAHVPAVEWAMVSEKNGVQGEAAAAALAAILEPGGENEEGRRDYVMDAMRERCLSPSSSFSSWPTAMAWEEQMSMVLGRGTGWDVIRLLREGKGQRAQWRRKVLEPFMDAKGREKGQSIFDDDDNDDDEALGLLARCLCCVFWVWRCQCFWQNGESQQDKDSGAHGESPPGESYH